MLLDSRQQERYHRHLLLRNIELEGQEKILNAKVLVIGAGGLGSPVLLYLAAAGVGTIGVADGDRVELSNLNRQIIHFTDDLDKNKTASAIEKINRLNPDVRTIAHQDIVDAKNIIEIIDGYDVIVDATDNFSAKFLINDACISGGKPFVHGSVIEFLGQVMTVVPGKSACYRCFFPQQPANDLVSSRELGILGAAAGIIGVLQSIEVIKLITGTGEPLINRLLVADVLEMKFREILIGKQSNCPVCSAHCLRRA